MQHSRPRIRIRYRMSNRPAPATGWLGKLLAVALAGVAIAAAFIFSIIFLAILAAAGVLVGGYLWFKTRALRRQLREQFAAMQARAAATQGQEAMRPQGDVIEGEFARTSNAPDQSDQRSPM